MPQNNTIPSSQWVSRHSAGGHIMWWIQTFGWGEI